MTSAEQIFKMLSFQYAPLEKALREAMSDENRKNYDNLPAERKIQVLDNVAAKIGL